MASCGASLTQLNLKLCRTLLEISVMINIFFSHIVSHPVSYRFLKISVLPQFPSPQLPLQRCELPLQFPITVTRDCPDHLSNRPLYRKRKQYVSMIHCHLQLHNRKTLLLIDLPYQLLHSHPYISPFKYPFPILRAPLQLITCIVDRMTRSLDSHAPVYHNTSQGPRLNKEDAIHSPL